MTYFDGIVYKGDFVNGKEEGEGEQQWPDGGPHHRGKYMNGMMNGKGLL
jgi:hypothetical protein